MSLTEEADLKIILESSGRIVIPPETMKETVLETPGCRLWYNKSVSRLGIRLLRGEDSPPVLIHRVVSPDGRLQGIIEAADFIEQIGIMLPSGDLTCPFTYFTNYHLLEVQLPEKDSVEDAGSIGFFNDYQPLED